MKSKHEWDFIDIALKFAVLAMGVVLVRMCFGIRPTLPP